MTLKSEKSIEQVNLELAQRQAGLAGRGATIQTHIYAQSGYALALVGISPRRSGAGYPMSVTMLDRAHKGKKGTATIVPGADGIIAESTFWSCFGTAYARAVDPAPDIAAEVRWILRKMTGPATGAKTSSELSGYLQKELGFDGEQAAQTASRLWGGLNPYGPQGQDIKALVVGLTTAVQRGDVKGAETALEKMGFSEAAVYQLAQRLFSRLIAPSDTPQPAQPKITAGCCVRNEAGKLFLVRDLMRSHRRQEDGFALLVDLDGEETVTPLSALAMVAETK